MAILPQIKHIVVVMLENRSFDNMLGWLYANQAAPQQLLPATNRAAFDGLNPELWNPQNADYFEGAPAEKIPIFSRAANMTTPNADPKFQLHAVIEQIYGPDQPSEHPRFPMMGFVVNYQKVVGSEKAAEIMESYSPEQVQVISALARNFAVSDSWFCSVPSQTWPNRAFVHAGTSNGNADNGALPNPLDWDVRTIFHVLEDMSVTWNVYSDTTIIPSLTRTMFPKLWPISLEGHFKGFDGFQQDCKAGSLPAYSFLEPSFIDEPNDEHPPHDVNAGERFLAAIWQAVSQSPAWKQTLLIVTYDEHGGTYDHVLPPWNAACPDAKSSPGREGFAFNRFGVRVPMVAASPWIASGTVFRTDTDVPYDHTSILATLRDWLEIPADKMLASERIRKAPTLAQVLNLQEARTDIPYIAHAPSEGPKKAIEHAVSDPELNDLETSIVSGTAVRQGNDPMIVRNKVRTRKDAVQFFTGQKLGHR